MPQTGLIANAHNDLVTDAAYDFYGLHLATCSLDQRIKVWQMDESNGSWTVEDDWKAHDAAVSKVSWAHPEFGAILASSSFDRTVKVWEQMAYGESEQLQTNGASSSSKWVERAVLVDAKGTVRAVEFAPQSFGLKLATISSDNHLRIYECLEQPSLKVWQLTEEVDISTLLSSTPAAIPISQTANLATPTQTSNTLDGASVSLVAHALQQQQQQQQNQNPTRPGLGYREADGGWCMSWCKDKYWGEIIAAGCGTTGVVKVIQLSSSHRPSTLLSLDPSPPKRPSFVEGPAKTAPAVGDTDNVAAAYAVTSVAWAPSCGRSYHLIATGSRDGHVRIWRCKPPTPSDEMDDSEMDVNEKWTAVIVGDFDDHKSAVGRVEWNITGTVLSSAGNDGRIRLWKATVGSVWRPAGHLSVEQAEDHSDVTMDDTALSN